jgi:hypothetical protein
MWLLKDEVTEPPSFTHIKNAYLKQIEMVFFRVKKGFSTFL